MQIFGFNQSQADQCLFIYCTDRGTLFLIVYVDDLLITGTSEDLIRDLKHSLHSVFSIKDLGNATYFLGLEISRSGFRNWYQSEDTGMTEAKDVLTPLPKGLRLRANEGELLKNAPQYRRLIGRLLYLGFTCLDLVYAVHQLSQFVHQPCQAHWCAALHIIKYLKFTANVGLFFPVNNSLILEAYSDADWAACGDIRHSIIGFCIYLGSTPVSWKSKKQATVSRSIAEAEYRNMAATVSEIQWITYLLQDFNVLV